MGDEKLFERCDLRFEVDHETGITRYVVVGYDCGSVTVLGSSSSFDSAERLRLFWQAQVMPVE